MKLIETFIYILTIYQVLEAARDNFTQEISFQSKDKDLSLAKVILFLYLHFLFEVVNPQSVGHKYDYLLDLSLRSLFWVET